MNFIKITIPKEDINFANQWVVENTDPNGVETFKLDEELGQASIMIPESDDDYTTSMKDHFTYDEIEIKL